MRLAVAVALGLAILSSGSSSILFALSCPLQVADQSRCLRLRLVSHDPLSHRRLENDFN